MNVGEAGERGQERYLEENFGCGGQGGWVSEHTSGDAREVRPSSSDQIRVLHGRPIEYRPGVKAEEVVQRGSGPAG